jgi:hypothetical protein
LCRYAEARHALLTQMRSSRLAPFAAKAVVDTLKPFFGVGTISTKDGLVAALVLGGFLDGALTQAAAARWYATDDGKRTALALAKACMAHCRRRRGGVHLSEAKQAQMEKAKEKERRREETKRVKEGVKEMIKKEKGARKEKRKEREKEKLGTSSCSSACSSSSEDDYDTEDEDEEEEEEDDEDDDAEEDELSELHAAVLRARMLKALHAAVSAAPPGALTAISSKLVAFLAEEAAVPADVPAGLTVEGLAAASAVLCPRVAAEVGRYKLNSVG